LKSPVSRNDQPFVTVAMELTELIEPFWMIQSNRLPRVLPTRWSQWR